MWAQQIGTQSLGIDSLDACTILNVGSCPAHEHTCYLWPREHTSSPKECYEIIKPYNGKEKKTGGTKTTRSPQNYWRESSPLTAPFWAVLLWEKWCTSLVWKVRRRCIISMHPLNSNLFGEEIGEEFLPWGPFGVEFLLTNLGFSIWCCGCYFQVVVFF